MPQYPLTPEQEAVIALATQRGPTKVRAYAGAGKTSTLVRLAEAMRGRGLYMAFNKSIATEAAAKFPGNVACSTVHSLAYRAVVGRFNSEKMTTPVRIQNLEPFLPRTGKAELVPIIKGAVLRTLQRFCASWDAHIEPRHVPLIPGVEGEDRDWVVAACVSAAGHAWAAMSDPRNPFPLGHDGYVKTWALSNPALRADYLLVDEAQDLNPVLIGVLQAQKAQVICVGDSHQQIYEWRGARDALNILPGAEARLTQSFRFGAAVAEAADGVLRALGETFPLRGLDSVKDAVITDRAPKAVDAVLCRTNAGVIDGAMRYMEGGRKVWVPGGVGELIAQVEDAERLQSGGRARTFELAAFTGWDAVQAWAKSDDGASLRSFVSLVERYGPEELLEVLRAISPAAKAPRGAITLSTGHKAKGLEWDRVAIADDFYREKAGRSEQRLFYVAATRARRELYVDQATLDVFSRAGDEAEEAGA